jgi:hypothetical protein
MIISTTHLSGMKFEPIDKLINKEQSFKQNLFNKE